MEYLLLILGFVCLIKGADFFVDGAASIAYRFHISPTIVGLTIVALGTSLPEAAVSISASVSGSNALAISNVVGSNFFNTLCVVGCSALIAPFVIPKEVVKRDLLINGGATLLLLVMVLGGVITRVEGAILLIGLLAYLVLLILDAKKNPAVDTSEEEKKILPNWMSIIFIVGGALLIMFGGNVTVNSAKAIALTWGMSETLVGLTVVSVGTSLPELVTSIVAAQKGESGLSIGNAIGSNIMNILFILGASSIISPLTTTPQNLIDICLLLVVGVFVFIVAKWSRKMTRPKACGLILIYVIYMAYIIVR